MMKPGLLPLSVHVACDDRSLIVLHIMSKVHKSHVVPIVPDTETVAVEVSSLVRVGLLSEMLPASSSTPQGVQVLTSALIGAEKHGVVVYEDAGKIPVILWRLKVEDVLHRKEILVVDTAVGILRVELGQVDGVALSILTSDDDGGLAVV